MKKILLFSLIIMVLVAAGVVQPAVYGADEEDKKEDSDLNDEDVEFLTPSEKAFMDSIYSNQTQILSVWIQLKFWQEGGLDFTKRDQIIRARSWLLKYPSDFSIQSAPGIFERHRTEWNTQVCPGYETLYGNILSSFEDTLAEPNLTQATTKRLTDRLLELYQEGEPIAGKATDIALSAEDLAEEVIRDRKQLREKAKPVMEAIKDELKKKEAEDKKNQNVEPDEDKDNNDDDDSLGCFIATAAYGSPMAEEIAILHLFRDEFLMRSPAGKVFIAFYYAASPPMAKYISEHELIRIVVREGVVDPIASLVELTRDWWVE